MNQRMIELYKEASEFAYKICREQEREGGTSDHIWNMLCTGKFAELIVRECARQVNCYEALNIFEHFGVAE
jgi:hypothetical protein